MTIFENLSIKNKMIAIILLISTAVVVLTVASNVVRTSNFNKVQLLNRASLEAKLIGEYSMVPLSFDDEQEAARILERLRAIPEVDGGYVYDDNGTIFAVFEKTGEVLAPRLPSVREQAYFAEGYLHTYEPIIFETKDYGTVYLRISTAALARVIREEAYFAIAIGGFLLVASYFLALLLQGLISKPVLELAETAESVSAEGDYSIRVHRRGDDEISVLYDEFNNMLEQIDARDRSLTLVHNRLTEAQRIAGIGNWDWNIVSGELWWSDEIYRMFKIDPEEFGANYDAFLERVHPEDRGPLSDAVRRALNNLETYSIDHRIVRPDGVERVVHEQAEVTFNEENQAIRMVGTVLDITERKQAEQDIRQRAAFQELLADISSKLIRAQKADINPLMISCLGAIGGHYELDSISLWWITEDSDNMVSSHRWERAKGRKPPNHRGRDDYPWVTAQLLAGGSVIVDDVEQLPPEAAKEQEDLRHWGTKSFLILPMPIDNRLAGMCTFSTMTKKREWSVGSVAELKLVSENLAIAFSRIQSLKEIEQLKDQLQEENVYLRKEVRVAHGFDTIIGESVSLRAVLVAVEQVAPTDVSVLITGETGTGKELISQAVHDLSPRKNKPLVSINCAALSAGLIESELFGHEKGAFTGAHERRKGRFELADGGTLFLDEIAELPSDLQAKLLRVLQEGEFERLGGVKTLRANVRIIAATNQNLQHAVDEGGFRADLYYRINSFPIHVPSLRERKEDIPLLTEYLVRKNARKLNKEVDYVSARTLRYLQDQSWPGNVRELEGTLQRALISMTGSVLDYTEGDSDSTAPPPATGISSATANLSDAQRTHILEVLEQTNWVIQGKKGAAFALGLAPSSLRSKMKSLKITRPKSSL